MQNSLESPVINEVGISSVELGLGLISIGRPWGFVPAPLPSDEELRSFLMEAITLGIRFFDTAPSYGTSEERLGALLRTLPQCTIRDLIIATKFGEHWDRASDQLYVDHSYDALSRSFDRSLELLGKIDVLQVHKAERSVLRDPGVRRALEHAQAAGVKHLGASVKDMETAEAAINDPIYSYVQFPFNLNNRSMEIAFEIANTVGKQVLVNRPFGMGQLLYEDDKRLNGPARIGVAYDAILKHRFSGFILTGTRSVAHLRENVAIFKKQREQQQARLKRAM